MGKRIFITESQLFKLDANISNSNIFNTIDSQLLSKFKEISINNALSSFNDDISKYPQKDIVNKLNKLIEICKRKEEKIRPQLEKICYNTVVELFNVPEDIVYYECHLKDEIDPNHSFRISPDTNEDKEYNEYSEIENEKLEIEKRKIIQSLFIGSSLSIYEKARKLYIDDVFELDEDLPHLYSKIMKINNYLISTSNIKNTDKEHNQSGFVEVEIGNNDNASNIKVEAIIFPILLTETIRGLMELIASNGLPDDKNMANTILSKVDVLEDEPFYMKYGSVMWEKLTNSIEGLNTKEIPQFFNTLVKLEPQEFIDAIREILYSTRKGKEYIGKIYRQSKHDEEYNSFQDDMMKKQEEVDLITDGYLSPDELY